MPKPMTAPARLDLLLPWLNGTFDEHVWGPNPTYGHAVYGAGEGPEDFAVKTDYSAIRHALAEFVQSFDGSAGAVYLEVVDDPSPAHVRRKFKEPTDDALGDLEAGLRILLAQGFGDGTMGDLSDLSFPMPLLRFAVRNAGRRKPGKRGSVIDGGVSAQRDYRAAGAYVLQVQGPTIELVPFLVAHLLTAPDMVAVRRCQRLGCDHFVVTATVARGRPRTFCSASCRVRNAEQLEQQRATRGRNKR